MRCLAVLCFTLCSRKRKQRECGCVMRRGGVFLCCFGLRWGMFLQLLILLPPAAYLWGSNLILSPTAYFLPTAAKSMKKCRQKPSVSGLPLPSRGLLVMGPSRELTQQQTRCRSRSGEGNISFTAGSTDSPGRTVSFFN